MARIIKSSWMWRSQWVGLVGDIFLENWLLGWALKYRMHV